jgi:phage terminase small subunit
VAFEDLTGKQRLFVDAYIGQANCNATEAAKLAGYSERTAYSIGDENLKKPEIRAAIDERMRAMSIPPEEILARLTEQARALHTLHIRTEGNQAGVDLEGLQQAGLMRLVKEIAYDRQGRQVIKFYDAQAALLALAKRYDLLPDHTKHSGQVSFDAVINALPVEFRDEVREELDRLLRVGGSNGKAMAG